MKPFAFRKRCALFLLLVWMPFDVVIAQSDSLHEEIHQSPSLSPPPEALRDVESEETSGGEPQTPRASQTRSTAEVAQVVDGLRGLASWTVIPFAHFQRDNRHVVIAWPAINSGGRLVDATVVGVLLVENEEGQLEERGRRWVIRDQSSARTALVSALGGTDFLVVNRNAGVALEQLGPTLSRLGSAFTAAVARGDRASAKRAASDFTQLLPLERVAYENSVAQLLWMAANHRGRLHHVRTVREGSEATLTLEVLRGRRRLRTIRATARQLHTTQDRWVIVNYQ